ncbi:TVP38/TMEM64 family protein [Bacillus piscicola]|uniref:TVP38/TMEM64 family protein n=1 Tax=Bacillus piscicola TaxID=1632684 RepID=UPI001F08DE62|nr:TVP38/TMEM64 family protein [Bacillus piscicola]
MNRMISFGVHFLAALFFFYVIGLSLSLLLIQNKWLDMRFDSEFLVLIMLAAGAWCYFAVLFMNAKSFLYWRRPVFLKGVLPISAAIILIITITNKTFFVMPAYVTRKGLMIESVLSLTGMNMVLAAVVVIGVLALLGAQKRPLSFAKGAPMEWQAFSKFSRYGMTAFFIVTALLLFIYLGQGEIQASANRAAAVLMEADVEAFRDYLLSFGPLAALVSGLLMVFQSVIAPLPAFVITFANGLLFGWVWGAVLSWSSAMVGASICYFIAKFFGRPVVEKLISKRALLWWDGFFEKYGKHSIFITRLVPIVSFDLVSYAAGVTAISFRHFFWATGLGQLPATLLYSYLGETASGSVKILFFVFTVVIAIAVLGSLLGPKLMGMKKAKAK